jgi:ADP-heptose:LPS heptosyltransferase
MLKNESVGSRLRAILQNLKLELAAFVSTPRRKSNRRHFELCIFKPDGIGDFVLALGAIRQLLHGHRPECCILLVWPGVVELAELEFPGVRTIVIPPFNVSRTPFVLVDAFKVRRILGTLQFERLVCLRHQRSLFQNVLLHWIASDVSYGLINQAGYNLGSKYEYVFNVTSFYPNNKRNELCFELEAHKHVVESYLERPIEPENILPILHNRRTNPRNYILVSPFSSASIKDYPAHLLEMAVLDIFIQTGLPIYLSYAPETRQAAEEIALRFENLRIEVLPLESTSFKRYLDSIADARAVLTVDTATAHIAVTFDRPTVVILGGGHYGQFGPWSRSPRQEWITNFLSCFQCNWHCSQVQPFCITRVPPADVASAMRRVLAF